MKKREFCIQSGDVDQFLELTVPSYFMMMQTIATSDAEDLNIGKAQTIDKGMNWVITRIEVEFLSTPKYTQRVKMQTYPGDDLKAIFPRYFKMEDESDNALVKSSSIWAVINTKTRMPVMKPFDHAAIPEHYDDELPLPGKVKIPEELFLVEERKVRFSDIDLNGHLNNTKYMDYILDVHNSDFYKNNRIKHVLINYLHEVRDGQTVELYTNKCNPEVIVGKVDGAVVFACEFTFENR